MEKRPETTLFMLMSADGKISTGDTDDLDFDRDLREIDGIKEGLHQYYNLEQETDLVSLNTGRVMKKIGLNDRTDTPQPIPVSFVIVDNRPHLTRQGIEYLSKWVKTLYLVTTHKRHPAKDATYQNVIILEQDVIDFSRLFNRLRDEFGIERLTIQSGGTLNAELIRNGLIDHLSLVIAPCLVGGSATPTLIDGESLHTKEELFKIKPLKLIEAKVLSENFLHVRYDVLNG